MQFTLIGPFGGRNTRLCIVWFSGILLASSLLQAQPPQFSVDSLLVRAHRLQSAFYFDSAQALYEQALATEPTTLAAYSGLGEIALARRDWRKAKSNFEKILEAEPENRNAIYYRAICERELGKFRPKFLREMPFIKALMEFKRAEQGFQQLLSADSLYRDVLYQLAILRWYQEKFDEAIALAERQLELKPEASAARVGVFEIYRQFIIRNSLKEVEGRLRELTYPHAPFFIAEKLRREHRYAEADSLLLRLLTVPRRIPVQAIYLALTQSLYAQSQDSRAELSYWQAVDRISKPYEADLIFEDLKYLLTDAELHAYLSLETADEKADFIRAFWARRNPTPAAELNPRLAEHYRRLNFAEENYEYVGFRSWANSPDKLNYLRFPEAYYLNSEFNDKGLVYLRHGAPDDRIVTVGSGAFSNAPIPPSNESWKYWSNGIFPELTFHFLYDQDVSGNLWRLTPVLTHPAMLEDRLAWNPNYYRLGNAAHPADRFVLEEEMAQESAASVKIGFATDRHSWDKKVRPLDVPFTSAAFRGPNGQTMVEFYFAFPLNPIAEALPDQAGSALVERGVAVHRMDWRPVRKDRETLEIPINRKRLRDDHVFSDFYRAILPPDSYFVAIHIKPLETHLLGGHARIPFFARDFRSENLMMSDIELASLIEPATREGRLVRNGLVVVPNPSRQYKANKPVYIYFEVYNLQPDPRGIARFRIEYTVRRKGGKRKLFGLFGGGTSSISVKNDRQTTGAFSAEFLAIDAEKLGKGAVELRITVTDLHSGASVERSNAFILY